MKAIKLRPWDSGEHLKTEEEMLLYLEACLEEGDAALIAHALDVIAKARGKTHLARDIRALDARMFSRRWPAPPTSCTPTASSRCPKSWMKARLDHSARGRNRGEHP